MEQNEYLNIYLNEDKHFFYVSTHELVLDLINWYSDRTRPMIVDVGCGTGGMLKKLEKLGKAVGVDKSDEAIKLARKRGLKIRSAGVEKLPFASKRFDVVTCIDVIYHRWVGSDMKALLEMRRILKPGGILVLRVPAFPQLMSAHDRVVFTKRRYVREELEEKLVKAGFTIKKISYMHLSLGMVSMLGRLARGSAIFTVPDWLNRIMTCWLGFEKWWLLRWGLPFGQGLVAVAARV